MGEKCFGVLALLAESKKHDLLRETKRALTSWGRFKHCWVMQEKLERKQQKWDDFLQVNGCVNQEHKKC